MYPEVLAVHREESIVKKSSGMVKAIRVNHESVLTPRSVLKCMAAAGLREHDSTGIDIIMPADG